MASKHLGHKDFTETDIIENGKVNEDNLDNLCKQINDLSSYDKVGTEFYKIDKSMSASGMNRTPNFVLGWLRHLETLKVTSVNVGYLGRTNES